MKINFTIWILVFCLMGIVPVAHGAQNWAIKADYTETCSCNPACPCLFGSPSTYGHCQGNNLIQIHKGHFGNVNLDGLNIVTTFSLGKWLKIYVNENATDEQIDAAVALLKLDETFGMIYSGKSEILSVERAPINVKKTATHVKFSVPDSVAEIEMMKGRDGKPIRIQNLPPAFMVDHTQYKSVVNSHKSSDKEFKHSGTNGLTSRIEVAGK